MDASNFWFALGLTVFAGLSTGIGSALAFFTNKTNNNFLSIALGFSAGVMIYVSFIEIFPKANESLSIAYGETAGAWLTVAAFFFGILFIALIDRFIPAEENPHDTKSVEEVSKEKLEEARRKKLMRMGVFSAIAIAIHNFPEGIATFMAGMSDPEIALPIAIAIAIHNIPEGIAVSVPTYYATGNKRKAFFLSFLSGLAEPVGALIAYAILFNFLNDALFGFTFAAVAGIMVFISLDELLPGAREYGKPHLAIYSMIIGMGVMALSLLLFI